MVSKEKLKKIYGHDKDICEIYIVKNKINDKVYVGQSWNGGHYRFSEHMGHSTTNECPKFYNAVRKHDKKNFYFEILASCKIQLDADYLEDLFITEYNSIKNGYNIRQGGATGKMSEETKLKLSKAMMGHPVSQKVRDAVSLARKGIPLTEEHRIKILENALRGEEHPLFGTHQSEESKLKNSLSNKEHWSIYEHPMKGKILGPLPEETRRKISKAVSGDKNGFYGKTHSEETRAKLSAANKGKPAYNKGQKMPEEQRLNLIENHPMRGKQHTETSKRKMSDSQKGLNAGENNGMFGKTGEQNPFFGKKHTPETLAKIAATKAKNKLLKEQQNIAEQMQSFYTKTISLDINNMTQGDIDNLEIKPFINPSGEFKFNKEDSK